MKRFLVFSLLALAVSGCILFAPLQTARAATPPATAPAATQAVGHGFPVQTVGEGGDATPQGLFPAGFDEAVTLRVLTEGRVQSMSLREYLLGVLPAEMPTDFPAEALKAQAVASRTFALKQAQAHKHLGADVCANAACCQGRQATDTLTEEQRQTLLQAIDRTDGLVLAYGDALIDATFFSCSGGKTEAAVAVWGSDVPYLQAVDSPGEDAPHNEDRVALSFAAFSEKLTAAYPQAVLSNEPRSWFSELTYTEGGGIATVCVGGVTLRGTELRRLLGLRSTAVEITVTQDGLCFSTHGYGHRVGMSQYGAKAMADAGSAFDEILAHYYTEVALRRLYLSSS